MQCTWYIAGFSSILRGWSTSPCPCTEGGRSAVRVLSGLVDSKGDVVLRLHYLSRRKKMGIYLSRCFTLALALVLSLIFVVSFPSLHVIEEIHEFCHCRRGCSLALLGGAAGRPGPRARIGSSTSLVQCIEAEHVCLALGSFADSSTPAG